jgi:hypothetical protein
MSLFSQDGSPMKPANRPMPDLGMRNTKSATLWRQVISLKWVSKIADMGIIGCIALFGLGFVAVIVFNNRGIQKGLPGLGSAFGKPLAPLVQDQFQGLGQVVTGDGTTIKPTDNTVNVERK